MQIKAVGHCIVYIGLCLRRRSFAITGELISGAQLGAGNSLQEVNFGES